MTRRACFGGSLMLAMSIGAAAGAPSADEAAVMALDASYQAAVERNDAAAMAAILADDFVLVTGSGRRFDKAALLDEARRATTVYEVQHASERSARTWGDTAVVTALLHAKGRTGDKDFEVRLWYSDTYVRMAGGWRYVFGQSSLPLPVDRSVGR